MQLDIRSRQLAAVERMLKLDGPGASATAANGATSQQWKVLIYDKFCRDIISPLITVGRLRENGVTLHMLIDSPRESIPDVPAVYFMQPTEENLHLFVQDCQKQLYDTAYLNFSSPLPRALMESLAKRLVEINAFNVVAKVFDQHLGFVSLEPRLFTLNLKDSFARYNSPSLHEEAIEQCMDEICRGACSMVATLGVAPIIRCPPGGPAEMVARKVCGVIRELQEQHSSFFAQGMGRGALEQRPMMLIVDRSVDMSVPLMHTSGYQTLVDDLLEFGLNRVRVPPKPTTDAQGALVPSNEPAKVHPLDKDADSFWAEFAGTMIVPALEAHSEQIKLVEQKEVQIRQQTGRDASSFGGATANGGSGGSETSALLSTVQSLPALLEKRRQLDRHMSILSATMDVVKRRQVYKFVEQEESMVFSKYAEKAKVLELAGDPGLSLQDKVRFMAVYMLSANPSQQDADEVESAVTSSSAAEALGPEERETLMRAVRYVKKILSLSRFGRGDAGAPPAPSGGGAAGGGGLWDLASLTRTAIKNASRQVKSIVGESKVMTSVRLMHLACKECTSEAQISEQDSQLLYLDPKIRGEVAPAARIRSGFSRGIVFVVGGGCFAEYQNLQDFAEGRLKISSGATAALRLGVEGAPGGSGKGSQFIYGCSELMNASSFMAQLAKCAN